VNNPSVTVTRIADGTYRVEHEGHNEIVYVAGPLADRWIFWKGCVFRGDWSGASEKLAGPEKVKIRPTSLTALTAPMPARVIRILVQPDAAVKKGETLVVLEAMKMELPVRAPADAIVTAVHCREGELVQADAVLLDLK
jgi:3-methylcrotonyl-CoA carboxylase alpha subunit